MGAVTLGLSRSLTRAVLRSIGAGLVALATLGQSAHSVAAEPAADVGAAPDPARAFVATSGAQFSLAGAPFRFVGSNMYNAAGDPAVYECGPYMGDPERELDDWFRRARTEFDGQVIRFWAFQSYTKGGTDWRAFDRVFRLANAHGLKVIPVLENQWAACTQGDYKTDTWYADGYARPYGAYPLSYREYVSRVVARYADEPAIAAWMLMNEAEAKSPSGQANPDALYSFAAEMSATVKRIDRNHLVTLGVMGSGQPGVAGNNFERLHALNTIDFLEYHDYGRNDEALPGSETVRRYVDAQGRAQYVDTLASALLMARQMNKPLLVGESGMTTCGPLPGWQPETAESRAQKLAAKLESFFANGGAGYLVWTWNPRTACDHDFTSGDPLNGVLSSYAARLRGS